MTPSRRQVLSAGAVAVVAACTRDRSPAPGPPDPDAALVAAAVTREQALLEAYNRLLAARPALAQTLAPLLGDHAAHLARLGAPSPSPTPTSSVAPGRPPTLPALRALERATATAHARAAEQASRDLAPLLASLAACEAVHAAVL